MKSPSKIMNNHTQIMKDHLFAAAKAYAETKSMKLTTIGMYATKDGRLFERIESGGMCSADVYDRVMQWLSDNWPARTRWPKGVPRPIKTNLLIPENGNVE